MKIAKGFLFIIISFYIFGTFSFVSCISEENYVKESSVNLKFSSDTLRFDTVFTTLGSLTKQVMIYNKENKPILIDQISLGGGSNSFFRLNVDGDTSIIAKNIEIGANDSLYIFARVTINPTNQNNPLLVQDSIIISFNNKQQKIQLEAYGQDAYYHINTHELRDKDGNILLYYCLPNDGENSGCITSGKSLEWKNDKPHVVFGTCIIDEDYTLNISEGTRIYMYKDSDIWAWSGGSLKIEGATNNPVVIQGFRTDKFSATDYSVTPGQWGKIYLMAGSKDNKISKAIIKNGTIGVVADTCVTNNPTLELTDTRIENMSLHAIYSRGATIKATNVIAQNTAQQTLALTMGGKYQFINCTFANYWRYDSPRKYPTLLLQNYYEAADKSIIIRDIQEANFYNTIVWGSLAEDEINIDNAKGTTISYYFENCLLLTKKYTTQNTNLVNCILNKDPLFNDPRDKGDLRLKEGSAAIGKGNSSWSPTTDINGNFWEFPPSIGAIEYSPIPKEN